MISNKRFDIYEHKNNDGSYNVTIRDNVKLKNDNLTYTQSFFGVQKKDIDNYKKQRGINKNNSKSLPF